MAYVQSNGAGNSTAQNPTLAFGSNVTAGGCLVVATCDDFGPSSTAPTDSQSNTYTRARAVVTDANFYNHNVWVAPNTTGGANTVTAHLQGTPSSGSWWIAEYSGRATSSVVTATATNEQATPGTGAAGVTCGPATAVSGDDAVLYLADTGGISAGTFSVGSGGSTERGEWGGSGVDIDIALHDKENVSAGSTTLTAQQANDERTVTILVLLASGGGAPVTYNATGSEGSSESGTPSVAFAPGIIYKLRW